MKDLTVKRFSKPDETRQFAGHGHLDLIRVEAGVIGRAVFEPGWRWSKDVKPITGTPTCEVAHSMYVLSGRMVLRMNDGRQAEFGPGDFAEIPPGHDAWVVGEEPCVTMDFTGAAHYAQAGAGAARDTDLGTPPRH